MNVLSREEQVSVLHQLVEGASLRSVTRLTRVHRTTVMWLMLRAGDKLRAFLDVRMRHLELKHLECDEIWTFVKKKQGKLTPTEAGNESIGDQYLYVAHYNFCRWHSSLKKTPAMAAGLTGHPWTMEELLVAAGVVSPSPS